MRSGTCCRCSSWRELDLKSCKGLDDEGLRALVSLPALRHLCQGLTATAVDVLVTASGIESLSLRGWKTLGEPELARLRAMPALRRLMADAGAEDLGR